MAQETKHIVMNWRHGMVFEGGAPDGPIAVVDGTNETAPGPMLQLLMALAACAGSDIVTMLPKMEVELTAFRMEVRGVRNETYPKRYLTIHMDFHLAGKNLDEAKARRSIELSLEKYCSVTHTLKLDAPITYDLHLG